MYHSLVLTDSPLAQRASVGRIPGQMTQTLPCHITVPRCRLPRVRIDPVTLNPPASPPPLLGRRKEEDDTSQWSVSANQPRQQQMQQQQRLGSTHSAREALEEEQEERQQRELQRQDAARDAVVAGVFATCTIPDWTAKCVGSLRRAEGMLVGDLSEYLQSVSYSKAVTLASHRAAAGLVKEAAALARPVLPVAYHSNNHNHHFHHRSGSGNVNGNGNNISGSGAEPVLSATQGVGDEGESGLTNQGSSSLCDPSHHEPTTKLEFAVQSTSCLLYTSPSPRDRG